MILRHPALGRDVDFSGHAFHPVVVLPPFAVVLDLSTAEASASTPWSVGRYDEVRAIYTQPLFEGERCVHVGIDLGGPVGTAVHAFADGEVVHVGYNAGRGDYGWVIVTGHEVDGVAIYALLGHLSAASGARWAPGHRFRRGEVLGWLGDPHENGGWPPHVHVQLAWQRPATHDLPGAVTLADRVDALARFPDPRAVLGGLY